MNRPAASQHVRSNTNRSINPGGTNNGQGSSGVNRFNNSVSSNRNVNRSYRYNNYGSGYGGYGYGGSGYGYGNGMRGYVRVYIPGLGWVLVPIQALRSAVRGTW